MPEIKQIWGLPIKSISLPTLHKSTHVATAGSAIGANLVKVPMGRFWLILWASVFSAKTTSTLCRLWVRYPAYYQYMIHLVRETLGTTEACAAFPNSKDTMGGISSAPILLLEGMEIRIDHASTTAETIQDWVVICYVEIEFDTRRLNSY